MTLFKDPAFTRGQQWASRRQELKVQRAFTPQHLRLKEIMLENALTARHTATGPDDAHVKGLMIDWLLIHEEIGERRTSRQLRTPGRRAIDINGVLSTTKVVGT